nr:PadR family transcriptional regulator [Halomarina rubra]
MSGLDSGAGGGGGAVDIRTIHGLTGFQRDLLYCIAGLDRPSGQSIREELEAQTDREITHGRLYPNLDTLVNKGLADKGEIDRRTNYYAISEDGVDALVEYHEWGSTRLP